MCPGPKSLGLKRMWGRTQATKMHPDDLTGPGLQESGTPPFTSERALGITRSLHG